MSVAVDVIERVKTRVESCVKEGGRLVVLGWRSSNHNSFTRGLGKRVLFLDEDVRMSSVPQNTGVILTTRWASHMDGEQLKRRGLPKPIKLEVGQIRSVLEFSLGSKKILPSPPLPPAPNDEISSVGAPTDPVPAVKVTVKEKTPLGPPSAAEIALARLFYAEIGSSNPDECVARIRVWEMVRASYGESAPSSLDILINRELLVGIVKEGSKRVSCYKAGIRLLGIFMDLADEQPVAVVATEKVTEAVASPGSLEMPMELKPLEKLFQLISSKDELLSRQSSLVEEIARIETLKAELSLVEDGLVKVVEAERLLGQIRSLVE
jgi:hypothetical protein